MLVGGLSSFSGFHVVPGPVYVMLLSSTSLFCLGQKQQETGLKRQSDFSSLLQPLW